MRGIKPSTIRAVVARDGTICHYCRTWIPEGETTLDHVWPKILGGTNAQRNLVVACWKCNHQLGDQVNKCNCQFCTDAATNPPIRANYRPPRPRTGSIGARLPADVRSRLESLS